jgi:threonylcarbamoyladenosine tRNA methylthiotransferase MtaB
MKQNIKFEKKRVAFVTLGCKVNQYDSDAMRSLFVKEGFTVVSPEEEADVYVVNTCSVTSTGDKKSRQVIRRLRREHQQAILVAAGCYAQLEAEEMARSGDVDIIIGNQNRLHVVEYVKNHQPGQVMNLVTDIMKADSYEPMSAGPEGEVTARAFIKVQEGCNNYCTFCIIPYARGRLKSRKQAEAVEEAASLVKRGFREVVLTGIHLGAYGRDLRDGTSLATLVEGLLAIPDLARIRLGSIESIELSDDLFRLVREEPRVCSHLHLPLQSGSEAVLKRMHRHYDLDAYKGLIRRVRKEIPGVALTTDLIVGFPGETEEQFEETLDTLRELQFSQVHVFPYSRREGTPAASYPDQISREVKKDRVHRVEVLQREINQRYRSLFVGKTVRVLAENIRNGMYEGLSDEYIRVFLKGDGIQRRHVYDVHVDGLTEDGLIGTVLKEE